VSIILFLIILVVLIVSHEFGHFIVAKWAKIRVDEFAVGFPPRLWSLKRGETEYSVNALPFGGYVKIFGENPDDESISGLDKERSFVNQPKWVQAGVISAGVIFNLLLAWVLLSVGFMAGFPTALGGSGYEAYAKDTALTVISVMPNTPASLAGIKSGDKIKSISAGGSNFFPTTAEEASSFIASHENENIFVSYNRRGAEGSLAMTPREGIVPGKKALGISMDMVGIIKLPPHKAVWEGAKNTYFLTYATVGGLFDLIKNALMGQGSLSAITGPVGIVKMVGDASSLGFVYLLGFTAIISINLAVVNLIPIPALDGGRLLFVIIEAIKRTPIKPSVANVVNTVGFAFLIILMIVVTYHDIVRLVVG